LIPSSEEYEEDMRGLVEVMLPHNLSLIAQEEDKDEMASVFINYFSSPAYPLLEEEGMAYNFKSWQARLMWEGLQGLKKEVRLEDRLRDPSSSYVEMFAGAVAEPYKRMGLALAVAEKCLYLFEELGYRDVVACCTSPYARKLMMKLRFKDLYKGDLGREILDYSYDPVTGVSYVPTEVRHKLKYPDDYDEIVEVSLHTYQRWY